MAMITLEAIDSSSDDELLSLLMKELQARISTEQGSPEFVAQIRVLPVGLRAMAATYELDVSLTLDDLGWHFGNWHSTDLSEETAQGLEELGASDLAQVFREVFQLARQSWTELGAEDWMKWYHGSAFERTVRPLDEQACSILDDKGGSIFNYWVDYARRHPERVDAVGDA